MFPKVCVFLATACPLLVLLAMTLRPSGHGVEATDVSSSPGPGKLGSWRSLSMPDVGKWQLLVIWLLVFLIVRLKKNVANITTNTMLK